MHEADKEKWLREVASLDFFQGEVALENDLIQKYLKEMVSLKTSDAQLAMRFAEVKGKLDAIHELQAIRKRIIDAPPQAREQGEK